MSSCATFKAVAMRRPNGAGGASHSQHNNNSNAQAGSPAMNTSQTGGAMKPTSKNINGMAGIGNYRQPVNAGAQSSGVSVSRPGVMGASSSQQQQQQLGQMSTKIQSHSVVKEPQIFQQDLNTLGASGGGGVSSRRMVNKDLSTRFMPSNQLQAPSSGGGGGASLTAARVANKLPSGGIQQTLSPNVADYYSSGSRNVGSQHQTSVGVNKRGQASASTSVVRKPAGYHNQTSRNNIASSMIKTNEIIQQGRNPQQKSGISGRMQKQFHQYMGHGGCSPPFKGQRTSMQTTLGGGTLGQITRQEVGNDLMPPPASLMTLIPIKVSATTLRETPKHSGSPPIIQFSHGKSVERSADRTAGKFQVNRHANSNERSRHRGQSQSTLMQNKTTIQLNSAARNQSIGIVTATLCQNHQHRPRADLNKPQSQASVPFTYYQGSVGDDPVINTSTGDILNTSHLLGGENTIGGATSPKTQRSPRLQQQQVFIPQKGNQIYKSPINLQKARQIPSNGSPSTRIISHQKTIVSSRLSTGGLSSSGIKKSISFNAQQIAMQQQNRNRKAVATLTMQQLGVASCLQIDLAQLSSKNIQVQPSQQVMMETAEDYAEGFGEQTPFVVYGATGSDMAVNTLQAPSTASFNEYNRKSPLTKRERSIGKSTLVPSMQPLSGSPSLLTVGTPLGHGVGVPNFFPRSPKASVTKQLTQPSSQHRHSLLNSTSQKQPQPQSRPFGKQTSSIHKSGVKGVIQSENVSAHKQTKTQRFKATAGTAGKAYGAAKNLQFSKYSGAGQGSGMEDMRAGELVGDHQDFAGGKRGGQTEMGNYKGDERRASLLGGAMSLLQEKILLTDMEHIMTHEDHSTPDRNQVLEVDAQALLIQIPNSHPVTTESPKTHMLEDQAISITPLRTSLEPKPPVEIGYISLQPSATRKSEQFSGLTSPKSVIKGTPKVVMVPVDEDEESTKFPMSKDHFTQIHQDIEEVEALELPDIVYFYPASLRPRTPDYSFDQTKQPNSKYDDEEGYYLIREGEQLLYRFEILKVLGKGSFAQVVSARDHKTGDVVAIKITRNTELDHKFAEGEAKLLRYLMQEDPRDEHNIVRLLDEFHFRSHHCFVFELLQSGDMFEHLKGTGFAGFSEETIKSYAREILRALVFLERHKIIHCDLKPENILIVQAQGKKNRLKLVDFGSGSFRGEQAYTYVQSRFYRAPEVILRLLPPPQAYSEKVDIWSLGCILAELFTGEPLFPGNNEQEQLELIMEICGIPPPSLVERCRKKEHYFDIDYSPFLIEDEEQGIMRIPDSKRLEQVLTTEDLAFIDFIKSCLVLDPDERFSASQAIQHPWLSDDSISPVTRFEDQKLGQDTERLPQSEDSSNENKAPPEESEVAGIQRPSTNMSQAQQAFIAATTSMRRREEEVKGAQLEESPEKDLEMSKPKKSLAQHFTIQTMRTDENPSSYPNLEVDSSTSTPKNEGCIQGGGPGQQSEDVRSILPLSQSSVVMMVDNNTHAMNAMHDMEVRFVNTNNLLVPLSISSYNSPNKKSLNTSTEKRRDRETRKAAAEAAAAASVKTPLSKSSLIVAQSPLPQQYDSQGQSVKVLGQYEIFRDDLKHTLTKGSHLYNSARRSLDEPPSSLMIPAPSQVRESVNSMTSGIASEANIPPVHTEHQGILSEESLIHSKSIKLAPATPQLDTKKGGSQHQISLQKVKKPSFNAHPYQKSQRYQQHPSSEAAYSSNPQHAPQSINSENSINKITITFYQKRTQHQGSTMNSSSTPKHTNMRK